MTVVNKAPHSVVSVEDRPTVILHMASGRNRAFTGVTSIYGGYAGGTLTIRHDQGTDTFKVKDAPNEYVPRASVPLAADKVKGMSVLDGEARRYAVHGLHKALTYVWFNKEEPFRG